MVNAEAAFRQFFASKFFYYLLIFSFGLSTMIPLAIVGGGTLDDFQGGLGAKTQSTCTVSDISIPFYVELVNDATCVFDLEVTAADSNSYKVRETCYGKLWEKSFESTNDCGSLTSTSRNSDCYNTLYTTGTTHTCWIDSSSGFADIKRSLPVEACFNTIFHGFLVWGVLFDVLEMFWPNNLVIPQQTYWKLIVNPVYAVIYFILSYNGTIVTWSNACIWGGLAASCLYWWYTADFSAYVGDECSEWTNLVLMYGIVDLVLALYGLIGCVCTFVDGSTHLSLIPLPFARTPKTSADADPNAPPSIHRDGPNVFIRYKFAHGTIREKVAIIAGTANLILSSWEVWCLHLVGICVHLYGWSLFDKSGSSAKCDAHLQYESMFFQTMHFYFYISYLAIFVFLLLLLAPINHAFDYLTGGKKRVMQRRLNASGIANTSSAPAAAEESADEMDMEMAAIPGGAASTPAPAPVIAAEPVQPTKLGRKAKKQAQASPVPFPVAPPPTVGPAGQNITINVNVPQPFMPGGQTKCSHCGMEAFDGQTFCGKCGKKIQTGMEKINAWQPLQVPGGSAPPAMFMPADGMGVAAFPVDGGWKDKGKNKSRK